MVGSRFSERELVLRNRLEKRVHDFEITAGTKIQEHVPLFSNFITGELQVLPASTIDMRAKHMFMVRWEAPVPNVIFCFSR